MGLNNIFKPLSTFLLAAPFMNLSKIDNFSSEQILGMLGPEANMLLCRCAMPPSTSFNL